MRRAARWAVTAVLVGHGAVSIAAGAAGAGWIDESGMAAGTAAAGPAAWLLVGIALVVAGLLLGRGVPRWWAVGLPAALASEALLLTAWPQAAAGTAANAVVLLAALHGVAVEGPWGLRARYRRLRRRAVAEAPDRVASSLADGTGPGESDRLGEADLAHLPAPVAAYVRASGALGRPRVVGFRARISGRIRGGPDDPWMPWTGEQVNAFGDRPTRLFVMDATMRGLPADVLHVYADGRAEMTVRVAGIVPVVAAGGPDLVRAETVTVLNDLCVLAPGALPGAPIEWQPIDDAHARATVDWYGCTVSATLVFDHENRLVDFVSDDRLAASRDGREFTRQRWSTPLGEYERFDGRLVAGFGHGRWHPEDGPAFDYLDFRLHDIAYLAEGARSVATASSVRPA